MKILYPKDIMCTFLQTKSPSFFVRSVVKIFLKGVLQAQEICAILIRTTAK